MVALHLTQRGIWLAFLTIFEDAYFFDYSLTRSLRSSYDLSETNIVKQRVSYEQVPDVQPCPE